MQWHKFLAPMITLTACAVAAPAQMPTYHVGRTPSEQEVRERDIFIDRDGKQLPPGRGTVQEGAKVYAEKCAACHGSTGTEGGGGHDLNDEGRKALTGSRVVGDGFTIAVWENAPLIWDKINRSMPFQQQNSLKPDEVYAVTAWLLYRNGLIKESDVLNEKTLPKVQLRRTAKKPPQRQ